MFVISHWCFHCYFVIICTMCFTAIHSVIWIHACCKELYVHCSPQESMVWGSAAQMVDGNLRVPAPGFWSSTSLYSMRPWGLICCCSEPALYRLLTFQVRNLMSLFCCLGRTVSVQVWGFVNILSAVCDCLFNCCAHGNICKLCWWFGNRWRVGGCCDPGPFSTWFLLFFLSARPWGLESFTLAVSLRSGRVEFLRGCHLNRTHKWNARYLGTFSAAA